MPHVDADTTVRASGILHDAPRIAGGDDVGERNEFESDDEPVIGGAITQGSERTSRRLAFSGWTDDLEITTPEGVGHSPRRFLPYRRSISSLAITPESGDDLDLGEFHVVAVEQFPDPRSRPALGLELQEVPDEQSDAPEAVLGGQTDPILDRMHSIEGEMTEDHAIRE